MKKKIVQWVAHLLKVNIILLENKDETKVPHKYETSHSRVIRAEVNVDHLLFSACRTIEDLKDLERRTLDEAFKTMKTEIYKNCTLYRTRNGLNERFKIELQVVKPNFDQK